MIMVDKPLWSEVIIHKRTCYLSTASTTMVIAGVVLAIIYHGLYIGIPWELSLIAYTLLSIGTTLLFITRLSRIIIVSRTKRFIENVDVNRIVDEEVSEGEKLLVNIEVSTRDHGSPLNVLLKDTPPKLFNLVDGGTIWRGTLYPNSKLLLEYSLDPVMGSHLFDYIELRISDPFKLYTSVINIPCIKNVRILPKILIDPREIVLNLESLIPGGLTLTHTPGVGVEYFFTREYRFGDDYRFIDWKATARTREVMVKEFEREAFLNILFYMIITPSLYRGVRGTTEFEYLSRITSTLANYLAFRGDNFALGYVITTSRPTKYFSGYGRGYGHVYVVRKILADIPWIEKLRFHDVVDEVIDDLYRYVRRDKTIVIILADFNNNLLFSENIAVNTRNLLRRGHELIYILPDPILFASETIRKHLVSVGRRELAEPMERVYRVYHSFDRKVFEDIKGVLKSHGFKVVHTTPYKTILEIVGYIELLRRYYG